MVIQLHKVKAISSILLVFFLFFQQKLNAQYTNSEYTELTGGLISGITFMQVDGDGYKGYHKTGFTGGGILYLPFGDVGLPFDATVALSMEVLYTQKGSLGKGATSSSSSVTGQDIRLHYGQIPIQVNIYRGARKSSIGMGLAIGYLGLSEETIIQDGKPTLKNALPFRKFDLSYVLTANLHLWKGFFFSPRFDYSLISIRNNNGLYGGRNEQFNNVWALRIMYLIQNKGH